MITNKFHEKIVNQHKEQIALLVMQLREAKDLKEVLTAIGVTKQKADKGKKYKLVIK